MGTPSVWPPAHPEPTLHIFQVLIFADVYLLFTGQTSDGFTVLELAYSFGLGIGIILFFNHFAGKRIETDPTPMDVQMHTYEQDVNQTIMSNYGVRKQQEKTTGEKR